MTDTLITPVILSGGSGTRLWPMSRPEKPKQLLALTAIETMLQLTAQRVADQARFACPIVVANAIHADEIETQLTEVGCAPEALILEPIARNTAPAIALAALICAPETPLLVMPSDHVVEDVEAFRAAIEALLPFVNDGWLATFGITPDAPETGYGYIKVGAEEAPGVRRVERFVEKPDRATAEAMIASGDHVWNGGIFMFRADVYLGALASHAPEMIDAARRAIDEGKRDGARLYPDPIAFGASPSDSIDYAVMEKAWRVAVAPVKMGWSDVGSWDALHALSSLDGDGNAHHGEVIAIDSRNCLIRSDGIRIAAVGIEDLIIVASGDSVLVLPRGRSQDVKKIVEALKDR